MGAVISKSKEGVGCVGEGVGVSREFRMGIPSGISESCASAIRPVWMHGMILCEEGKQAAGKEELW